jgi:hypothetical protein
MVNDADQVELIRHGIASRQGRKIAAWRAAFHSKATWWLLEVDTATMSGNRAFFQSLLERYAAHTSFPPPQGLLTIDRSMEFIEATR